MSQARMDAQLNSRTFAQTCAMVHAEMMTDRKGLPLSGMLKLVEENGGKDFFRPHHIQLTEGFSWLCFCDPERNVIASKIAITEAEALTLLESDLPGQRS